MKTLIAAILLIAAPALAAPAPPAPAAKSVTGQRSGSNAPITINSDTFQADLNAKSGTYNGNVIVTQADMKLRANTVKVTTVDGKGDKVMASGNVVVDSPKSGTVTGEQGVYSIGPRTVVMTGNVTLKKGRDVMRGCQLTVNMVSGQAVLGSCGKAATPGQPAQGGGRVQAVILPNSQ